MRRRASAELERFESLRDNVHFRRTMTLMTLVWGFGLVGEALVSGVLVFRLSIHDYLLAGPVLGYATTGGLAGWTFWYSQRAKRKGEARRAAEAEGRARAEPVASAPASR